MRVTSIGLYSQENEVAHFEFEDPSAEYPYLIKKIEGLDSDEIVSKFYGFGIEGRGKLNDLSLPSRTVVLEIALTPRRHLSETFSSLRDNLYRAVYSNRTGELTLRFNSGIPWYAYLKGMVTKFEAPITEKEAKVVLTINCEDPRLLAYNAVRVLQSSLPSGLNPIVISDDISTAPHGFKIQFTVNSPINAIYLKDSLAIGSEPDWFFWIVYPFLAGDVLLINSQYGEKAVVRTRGAEVLHIADMIQPDSVWPMIFPGTNNIEVSAYASVSLNFLDYTPEFWGV